MRAVNLLVVYDISDSRTRRRVSRMLSGYGRRLQRSVFLCRLPTGAAQELRACIERLDARLGGPGFSIRAFRAAIPAFAAAGPETDVAEPDAPTGPCLFA